MITKRTSLSSKPNNQAPSLLLSLPRRRESGPLAAVNSLVGIFPFAVGLLFIFTASSFAASPAAQAKADEAADLFAQANAAAVESQARDLYQQAALRYRYLIEQENIRNFYVYYNLANACQLSGDLGSAILNYRRAQRYQPDNPDVLKNLAFARLKRLDNIPAPTAQKVAQTLFFWHYDLSLRTRLILLAVFWCLFWANAVKLLFFKKYRVLLWTCCLLSGLLVLAFASSLSLTYYDYYHRPQGVIVASQILARQGDGDNYLPSFQEPLHAGVEFILLEQRRDWLHIRLPNSADAWIPAAAAEII